MKKPAPHRPLPKLADWLRAHDMRHEDLAEELGLSRGRITQWINGDPVPLEWCGPIHKATDGAIRVEYLRPDLEWKYFRGRAA